MSRERRAHFRVRYGGEREEGGGEVEQERAKERGRGGEGRETLIITKRNEVTKRNEQCPVSVYIRAHSSRRRQIAKCHSLFRT